jgi:biotin operon repressor
MNSGYIKVHRALLEWEWYHDDRCVRLLLHLLLKANYTDRKWKGQALKPGQLITSSVSLAEQLGWSRSALNRTMDKLKRGQEIETASDNKWTLVTLRKWEQFQYEAAEPDSNRTADRTATGHS